MARTIASDLIQIYKASVKAVLPHHLIRNCVKYNSSNDCLTINGDDFNLENKRLFVVGAGKAVKYMAQEVDQILGNKIQKGIISIPVNSRAETKSSKINYCEGAKNNLPDDNAVSTAQQIKELATSLTIDDVLLVLVSGGGSALLPLPKYPISLKEKTDLVKKLANSGADIKELNTVRKKISEIKGGKLAIYAKPALTVSLILSDIVGDPLELIASGPTIQDTDHPEKAKEVIKKFNLYNDLPKSIKHVLETDKTQEFPSDWTRNYLIGSNKMSISAARKESEAFHYLPLELSNSVTGNITILAKEYAKLAKAFCLYEKGEIDIKHLKVVIESLEIPGLKVDNINSLKDNKSKKDICLILGGEPTVEVKGAGLGGRNQQLALEFSYAINEIKDYFKNYNVFFLSAGTDGIDGPTDAAGAISYLDLIEDCRSKNMNVEKYLENNDSYNFYKDFENGKYHVVIGHTNTNVMDIHLMVIQQKCK